YTAPAGAWVHLAFVGNGSQTLLYANGVFQGATNSIPLPRAYMGAAYVSSGSRFVDYMLGGIDEILCFNRVLSAAEISAIYGAGSAGLVRAPEFTAIVPLGQDQFQLNLKGITGKTFTIYRSADLATWTVLGSVPNPNGVIQF